jgi:hypothetical protein
VYFDLVVLLSLSVVGFGVLLSIGIASVSFGQQFLNYKSNTIGVQIDYPDEWVYTDFLEIVFFVPSNESKLDRVVTEQEVLFIIAQDTSVISQNITVESYIQYVKGRLENRSDFVSNSEPQKTELGDLPAYSMEFINSRGMPGLLFALVNNGKPYAISYVATDDKIYQYLPTVVKMLATMKFS